MSRIQTEKEDYVSPITGSLSWNDQELGNFKEHLMRRVYVSWFLRKVIVPAICVLPVALFVLYMELSAVNLGDINRTLFLKFSHGNISGLSHYFVSTLRYTEIDSLLIIISAMLLAAFFGRRVIKNAYFFWAHDPLFEGFPLRERRF
ncbi:hypothetical protein HYW53_00165 [Candidatus Giovannonibacteria bacterium]|nr:hypothetical protein [Candidatus Giovannonibacteria bacterium]